MHIDNYFKIVSTDDSTLYFEVKGFWSDVAITPIAEDIFQKWKAAVDSFSPEQFITMPNMTDFKTARDAGKRVIGRMMKYAQENNLYHSIQIMPQAMARITISKPVNEVGHGNFRTIVLTLEEANTKAKDLLINIEQNKETQHSSI